MMTGPVFRIRRFLVGAAAVALALATVACAAAPTATPTPVPTGSPTAAPTGSPTVGPTAAPTPDLSGQEKYLTLKVDPVYPLAAGTNTLDPAYVRSLQLLGGEILAAMAAEPGGGNRLLSPLSLSMAFTMTAAGAKGETLSEMLDALRYQGLGLEAAVAQNRLAFENLYRDEEGLQVTLANSLWCLDDYPFHQAYLDACAKDFFASIRAVRRADGADPLALINRWASDRTNGLIPKVLDKIDPDIVLILVNALYFKGEWMEPFDSDMTKPGPFTRRDGSTVQADYMKQRKDLRVRETADAVSVALPYKGGMAMVVTLPKGPAAFDAAQKALLADALDWTEWTSQDVQIDLPRFSYDATIDLPAYMKALGMQKAFLMGTADFSGMSPRALQDSMYIAAAVQKTFISVTEKGTEAGAVTAVSMGIESLPRTVSFDRPFWFAIVDAQGVPLFLGAVEDPTASGS